MSVPAPRSESAPAALPPMLPNVVVVHAGDVDSGTASGPRKTGGEEQVAGEEALLAEDAIAKEEGPTPEIDRVQEQVMTEISPEGRPPPRQLRVMEWKWVLTGAGVLLIGAAVLVATSSMAWPTVAFAVVILLVLMGAAIPTWGAGLLRGGEEKRARVSALRQEERDRVSR